jgi:hypothetical protein
MFTKSADPSKSKVEYERLREEILEALESEVEFQQRLVKLKLNATKAGSLSNAPVPSSTDEDRIQRSGQLTETRGLHAASTILRNELNYLLQSSEMTVLSSGKPTTFSQWEGKFSRVSESERDSHRGYIAAVSDKLVRNGPLLPRGFWSCHQAIERRLQSARSTAISGWGVLSVRPAQSESSG